MNMFMYNNFLRYQLDATVSILGSSACYLLFELTR